jgi:hypothetical protein
LTRDWRPTSGPGPRRSAWQRRSPFVESTLEIERYFRACDLYVLPSIREGLPIALLEAMASGLPCIATAIAGSTDTLLEDRRGWLVPADDRPALTAALEALMADDEERRRCGAAARDLIVSKIRHRCDGAALARRVHRAGAARVTAAAQPARVKSHWLRTVLINVAVVLTLLLVVEVAARVAIYATRGTATAGLQERTLNLEYEPFVMFGPGWDARLAVPPADGLPTVLLVGGSTAQGFAPPILEKAIAAGSAAPSESSTLHMGVQRPAGGGRRRTLGRPVETGSPDLADGQNDFEHRLRVAAPAVSSWIPLTACT